MNLRKTSLYAIIAVLLLAACVFAEDRNVVPVEELQAEFTIPQPVSTVRPERVFYTPNREIEGYITLEITIDENGSVESAGVLYKTSQIAVPNAINAIDKWEFQPGKLNGVPVRSVVAYSLPFGKDLEILKVKNYKHKVIIDDNTLAILRN
ncbi:MAG: TonB family protein [Candidatus Electryonea clarkiae]|nr:TonB family protein [Candidatus Electryonea clarkiae]MDP8285494.1 TonB family protein [Candidatus Electryonea clarkiae]